MSSINTDALLTDSLSLSSNASRLEGEADLLPNEHWQGMLECFHARAFAESQTAPDLISFATDNNGFVIYRRTDQPEAVGVIDRYLTWLDHHDCSLANLPAEIAEMPFASPRVVFERRGRRVSTSFLWHLCAAERILKHLPQPATMLEIGPGFGGFARLMRLFEPGIKIVLVDLPQSLAFAHAYLSLAFPEARIMFLTERRSIDQSEMNNVDIMLIPTQLLSCLEGLSFDLAVNLASWGEMSPAAVRRYIGFIENDISVRWLYSVNQYGQHPPEAGNRGQRLPGADVVRTALPLSFGWRIQCWSFWDEESFAQADPLMAPCLEVLLARVANQTEDYAARLTVESEGFTVGSTEWHSRLWYAALIDPQGAGAERLRVWGSARDYPEYS